MRLLEERVFRIYSNIPMKESDPKLVCLMAQNKIAGSNYFVVNSEARQEFWPP